MKRKIGVLSFVLCLSLLASIGLADTSIHTRIESNGETFYNSTVNGESIVIENEGPVVIESDLDDGRMEMEVESDGEGEVTVEGKGEYEVEKNGKKQGGTLPQVFSFFEGIILKIRLMF